MKAFAYLRVSGRDQIAGDGFARQELAVQTYAALHDLEIAAIYREQICGETEGIGRPEWSRMVADCADSGVSVILIEALHRLARDLVAQETILRDCVRSGIVVTSTCEPDLMSSDPTRVLIRQIMESVGQYDKAQIVAKLRGARMRKKAATGRCEGAKPYGTLAGERAILDRIIALSRDGISINAIARALNGENIRPRSAQRWHPFTVQGIIRRSQS